MNHMPKLLVGALAALFVYMSCGTPPPVDLRAGTLTCEYLDNPLGIDETAPRLSWILSSGVRGQRQTAYRILVASSQELLASGNGDLWDSGKVGSDQSVQVVYAGAPLASRQRCWWKVMVWDRNGRPSPWSEPACWEMALLDGDDWLAEWIASAAVESSPPPTEPAPMFRRSFNVRDTVERARLYVTGLGYFECSLNGEKVGDHLLDPVTSRYDRRVYYVTHDVTESLREGENVLGMMLGTGWYNMHTEAVWGFGQAPWRARPRMLAQLEITYADGSRETVVSDGSWTMNTGPVVFDAIRNGETYDARLERSGWRDAGYDDSGWDRAAVVPSPGGVLSAQMIEPIRVTEIIGPVSVAEVQPGVWVYDLGQNIAGVCELTVSAPAGTEISMKQGERLYPDGTVEQKQIARFIRSGELQTDTYICRGAGVEIWQPRFVYHGFQYIEVRGFPGEPTLDNLRAKVVNTDFASAGRFACSKELFNRIQHCTRWSFTGNYHGIPTDCPHREKIGWTGDAHIVAETGLFNYHMGAAYTKWIRDFVDEQRDNGQLPGIVPTSGWGYTYGRGDYRERGYGPQWEGAFLLVPWYVYLYNGDERILTRHYEHYTSYVDYLTRHAEDYIIRFGIDDHAPADTHTGPEHFATGFFYQCTRIVSESARLRGLDDEAARYTARADSIADAYNRLLYHPATGTYGSGSQTSLSCPLYYGIVPESIEERVLANLVGDIRDRGWHLDTGVVGVKFLMNALVDHGRADIVYRIASQTTFPGWGDWVRKGANTLWQKWDDSMSRNHIMFGDISAWLFKNVGGLNADPAHPGFRRSIIRPRPFDDLRWAEAETETPYGPLSSRWERGDDTFTLDITVPVNTTALVYVPAASASSVTEGGTSVGEVPGVRYERYEDGAAVYTVGSGRYSFVSAL